MAEFDFLIVGAGSAGCVLAARLAQFARIGLIEAGGERITGLVRRPSDYIKLFGSKDDWGWETTAQRGLAGRRLRFPRGLGLGGSTRINASIWLKPQDDCLDRISLETDHEFSQARLRSAAEAVERMVAPESPRWLSESSNRFLQAAKSLNLDAFPFRRMNFRGVRRTAADFMSSGSEHAGGPYLDHQADGTLTVLSHRLVDRIEICNGKATGVCYKSEHGNGTLTAEHGVILCAGSIASPTILQRSGIGCPDRLRDVGIHCVLPLDQVGKGLRDHLIFPTIFTTPSASPFPTNWSPRQLARWQTVGTGIVTSNLAEAGLFLDAGEQRIQLHVTPTDYLRHPNQERSAMTLGVTVSHPASAGQVHIVSSQPQTAPQIDPGYLNESSDLELMVQGVETVQQLAQMSTLRHWVGVDVTPGKRDLRKSISRFSQTLYHPVGGCCLGTVVDRRLRVHDTENLWVADASIFPFVPAANPNPLIMAVAWALADSIRSR